MSQITITDKFLTIDFELEVIQINRAFITGLTLGAIVGQDSFGFLIKHDVNFPIHDRCCELRIFFAEGGSSIGKQFVIIPFHTKASAKLDPSKQNETFAALKAKLFGIPDPNLLDIALDFA